VSSSGGHHQTLVELSHLTPQESWSETANTTPQNEIKPETKIVCSEVQEIIWFPSAVAQIIPGTLRYCALLVAVDLTYNEINRTVEKLSRVEWKGGICLKVGNLGKIEL